MPKESGLGITINLPELRLYHIWKDNGRYRVRVYPIGIGRDGWNTPEGLFEVRNMIEEPTWQVPLAIRQENLELPEYVGPGHDNPLGLFWIGLSVGRIGLHGTNKPFGVGRRVSHGCIRLYNEDIRDLFARVSIETPVRVIYQPVKIAPKGERLFIEVHPDDLGRLDLTLDALQQWPDLTAWQGYISTHAIEKALREARGLPVPIGIQEERRR